MNQALNKLTRPFGLWPSPITPELIGQGMRLADVQWAKDSETLVWCQSISGKASILAKPAGEPPYELSGPFNPSGGVGYGGGEFCTLKDGVIFVDKNGRLYARSFGAGAPTPITPAFGSAASPCASPDGKWVLYINTYEDKDTLALVDAKSKHWPINLVQGADFYMQPAWSPNGKAIAWVEWNHPNMPWDGTRLMFALLEGEPPKIVEMHQLDGDQDVPVFQPAFSPDGRTLSYITNCGEWDQLVLLNLESGEKQVLLEDMSLLRPAWVQGLRSYAWHPDGQVIYIIESCNASHILHCVNIHTKTVEQIELGDYINLGQIDISKTGKLALIAQSPRIPARVITLENGQVEIVARSQSESIHEADLAMPEHIEWPTSDGAHAYGIYYPPTNRCYTAEGLPPVVVAIHGGPTSQVSMGYDLDAAFFTSRGYGYLQVNYRGSTGYGRSYMLALRQRWGEVDTLDAFEGSQALVSMGLADPNRLVIKGGSAGGYTVLNALIRYPGYFKAGICLYGVSNLFTLEMDTHKFESHYNATLVGELPEAASRFQAWSPIFHVEKIKDPIAIFQGSEDKVVPPNQSETIVAALKSRGVPHEYHLYEGEGHGFRKSETLVAYYKAVERFLQQYVIFSS